jgi:hypothetical protein
LQTKIVADLGIKKRFSGSKGEVWLWQLATDNSNWEDLIYVDPYVNFGGLDCRPIPGDYDGDGYDDRAVMCADGEWRIAFSGSKYPKNNQEKDGGTVTIPVDGKAETVTVNKVYRKIIHPVVPQDALPGFVYPGGVSYKETKAIFETVSYLCPTIAPNGNTPPCSLMTMSPAPVSPYFPQCVDAMRKLYKTDPCADPAQKVACETLHIQQAQCVWEY